MTEVVILSSGLDEWKITGVIILALAMDKGRSLLTEEFDWRTRFIACCLLACAGLYFVCA